MTRENRGELIRRLVRNGMGMVELHATWVEPRFNGPGISAAAARDNLRAWRLSPPAGYYRGIRKALGGLMRVCACAVEMFRASDSQ